MTKFEEIGIERQYNSCSKQAAIKAFEKSCDACCKRNMQIDCNKCGALYRKIGKKIVKTSKKVYIEIELQQVSDCC